MNVNLDLTENQFQVLHRALSRFHCYAMDHHDAASQDIEFKCYRKGAAENFYQLMRDTEIILDKIIECANES